MLLQNVQDEFVELINAEELHSDLCTPLGNMAIYRQNILASLSQTLRESYKMIEKLVGKDFFRVATKEYINRYPCLSGNLHEYGEYFGDFLMDYPPVRHLPYLTEVAIFEWACHQLYFSADASHFNIKSLESISPDQFRQLHFNLHPASRLIQFYYPILQIIDLCKGERDEEINLNEGGVNLLLLRRQLDVMLIPISEAEFTFLSALNRNENLGEALDQTMLIDPEFKLDIVLPRWIQDKTIVDFTLPSDVIET
jgi:hypothetical protein